MKIQVLELPMVHNGEYSRTPYALIFSEVPEDYIDETLNDWEKRINDADNGPEWVHVTSLEVTL
jgi:hypothetical protein